MASSKVMVSTAPTNPDLPRYVRNYSNSSSAFSSQYLQHQEQNSGMFPSNDQINGSMNLDDVLRNIYNEPPGTFPVTDGNGGEVWGEVGGEVGGSNKGGMTLETFLAKEGVMSEEEIRAAGVVNVRDVGGRGDFGMEGVMNSVQYQPMGLQNCRSGGFAVEPMTSLGFGNGMVAVGGTSGGGGGGGRGKRRAVEDVPLDKATQQRQKRMIKNRESAARSRERKQAYTVELEAIVTRLEEENARLLLEEAEMRKHRFKQLIEKVKPVVEERRPPQVVLRRSHSMNW